MAEYLVTKNAAPVSMNIFKLNRDRLVEKMKKVHPEGFIILKGGEGVNVHNTDIEYTFKQEPYFHWAFGVRDPQFLGVICLDSSKSYLFIPRLPESYIVWMGKLYNPEEVKALYDVDEVYYNDELENLIIRSKPAKVYLLSGRNTDSDLVLEPPKLQIPANIPVDKKVLYAVMSDLRVTKTELELQLLREACKVSSKAHKYLMRKLPSMINHFEYQAESIFLHYCYYMGGCRTTAYTCICGSGTNSSILHYGHAGAPNDKIIRDGDMCLFDMGASYYGYAADITCSFPANGKFTKKQAIIYNAVLKARNSAIKMSKPGVQWELVHLEALRAIFTELVAHNLLIGNVEEMLEAELGTIFMPHGLGHLMGIDVHDVGGYTENTPPRPTRPSLCNLRMNRILSKNMVLTIEPGCYFIEPLIKRAKTDPLISQFINFEEVEQFIEVGGIRIEDDCLITSHGCELLSDVPRTIKEIEAWMSGEGGDLEEIPHPK